MSRTVSLSDVCKITTGQSAPQDKEAFTPEGIPFIRAGSLKGLVAGKSEEDFEKINEKNAKKFKLKLFPKDTVIFAKSGMSAKIGLVYKLKKDCYLVSHLAAITPKKDIDAGYLHRWFQKNSPSNLIANDAYPSIKTSEIQKVKIPLPPLEEQKQIAAILDKADALRRKREKVIALTDDLLRSVFLDMFGDPVTNPKGWEMGKIGDLLSHVNYGTSSKAGENGQYPILRMNNITYEGGWDLSSLKYIDMNEKELSKYLAEDGDILFNRTNSKELVGKTAVFREAEPYVFAGYLVRAKTNEKAEPDYISAYLNSAYGKAILQHMCKNIVGMANINAKEFQTIDIPIPPITEQKKLSEIVKTKLKNIEYLKEAAETTDALFSSLTQRAFRGDLTAQKEAA